MFYWGDILRTSGLGDSISKNAEKTTPKRKGGNQDIEEFLQHLVFGTKDYC